MPYKNLGWVNLHNHGEFSQQDGFGKMKHRAKYAKNIGQNALAITDHGTVSGLVEHYIACKDNDIKPIMGCEVYFQPKFDKTKKYFHLCLFAKDLEGYQSLMKIISEANINNFYRAPIVTFENLKQNKKGIICSSACISGYPSKAILENDIDKAEKRLLQFKKLFGDDYYIELMPYRVMENGKNIQYEVDEQLIKLGKKLNIKCILTCDSHFNQKDDYDTFKLMFAIAGKKFDIDYSARYMPTEKDIATRFEKLHNKSSKEYILNTKELADKCNMEFNFEEKIPHIDWGMDSKKLIKREIRKGLKKKGKYNEKYFERIREELDVIFYLELEDYFLICWDIIKFAKDNDIGYGLGRGSVCGSLVAYALDITEVDPLILDTKFERFLRKDKKKMPDIDMDFCSKRRDEVKEYIYKRFEGRATQVSNYGYYKVKNLANDLGKVLEIPANDLTEAKKILDKMYPELVHGADVDYDKIMENSIMRNLEEEYGFVKHFSKLCGQVRYIGKHAGGVAITYGPLTDQMAVIRKGGQEGTLQSCYDLLNLDYLKVLKMDVLGLSTVTIIKELEQMTGEKYNDEMIYDEEIIEEFHNVNTTGIFQFDAQGAKAILDLIKSDTIHDVIAATALNRPAPITMKMPEQFSLAKQGELTKTLASKYLPNTYGCLVYQEDIFSIGKGLADLEWASIDKIMKGLKETTGLSKKAKEEMKPIRKEFLKSAIEKHPKLKSRKSELEELFDQMTGGYLFNKGHATGYILLSIEQMYFKHYYPLEFWTVTLKNEGDEFKRKVYESAAVKDGCIIIPAHMNGPSEYAIVEFGGGKCIQRGLSQVKNIGPKAAVDIEKNGPYYDRADFEEKVTRRIVNARVFRVLDEIDAFQTNELVRIKNIKKENLMLKKSTIQLR